MKKKLLLTLALLAMILSSCGAPGATKPPGESPATSTTEPPPDLSPLEWLAQAAFEARGDGQPDIVPANLPEGFNPLEAVHSIDDSVVGFSAYHSTVGFERSIGDGGSHFVGVVLIAHEVPEGRTYYLDSLAEGEYTWEFLELDGHQIARYYSSMVDARVWISGPYIVEIYGPFHTTGLNPWVDTFASLFLEMFPLN
jgi:hypothetical protein